MVLGETKQAHWDYPLADLAAVVVGRNERQPSDSRRSRGAAHLQFQRGALPSMAAVDVTHRDRPTDRGTKAATGHAANPVARGIDNLGVFARRCPPFRTDADTLARCPLGELTQHRGGTRKPSVGTPSFADCPGKISFDRSCPFIDVMP